MNTLRKHNFATQYKLNMKKYTIKTLLFITLIGFSLFSTAQEAKVKVTQPKAIDQLLELKKDIKTVKIFRIQIFSGNSSFDAEKAKSRFKNRYNEWPIEMVFNTPNYKIWVGNFRDRLEADRALLKIKKNYMNAFIFQPKQD